MPDLNAAVNSNERMFLLDTHAWVWLLEGKDEIKTKPIVEDIEAASEQSKLCVASISLWEIAMLESKGRLGFRIPCLQWLITALKVPGLDLISINATIAADSAKLPGRFHGDPADRLIVASARYAKAIVVTRDRAILDYADQGHVQAVII